MNLLRLARLAVITLVAGGIAWSLALPGGAPAVAAADQGRYAPVSRYRAVDAPDAPVQVRLDIDGLQVAAAAARDQSPRQLLAALGITLTASDRLSVDPDGPLLAGMRIAIDRGLPVTVVDGGVTAATRAPRGTVGELLAAHGLTLNAADTLDVPASALLAAGTVIRITRVADVPETEKAALDPAVRYVNDPSLESGKQVVETPGTPGLVERVWSVHLVDGIEQGRTLVSETVLRPPVAEVRLLGVRARVVPAAPGDIERIIRDAAARYGADPDQLLRVAWCESRYNPGAYNGILGASGLFQIIPGTWAANSVRAGYGGASVWDAYANANVAAWMFSRGQQGQWACK